MTISWLLSFTNLQDLKVHFLKNHEKEKSELVEHVKQNRINSEIYDNRAYTFEELFEQNWNVKKVFFNWTWDWNHTT